MRQLRAGSAPGGCSAPGWTAGWPSWHALRRSGRWCVPQRRWTARWPRWTALRTRAGGRSVRARLDARRGGPGALPGPGGRRCRRPRRWSAGTRWCSGRTAQWCRPPGGAGAPGAELARGSRRDGSPSGRELSGRSAVLRSSAPRVDPWHDRYDGTRRLPTDEAARVRAGPGRAGRGGPPAGGGRPSLEESLALWERGESWRRSASAGWTAPGPGSTRRWPAEEATGDDAGVTGLGRRNS